jgi:hypothetical protein
MWSPVSISGIWTKHADVPGSKLGYSLVVVAKGDANELIVFAASDVARSAATAKSAHAMQSPCGDHTGPMHLLRSTRSVSCRLGALTPVTDR